MEKNQLNKQLKQAQRKLNNFKINSFEFKRQGNNMSEQKFLMKNNNQVIPTKDEQIERFFVQDNPLRSIMAKVQIQNPTSYESLNNSFKNTESLIPNYEKQVFGVSHLRNSQNYDQVKIIKKIKGNFGSRKGSYDQHVQTRKKIDQASILLKTNYLNETLNQTMFKQTNKTYDQRGITGTQFSPQSQRRKKSHTKQQMEKNLSSDSKQNKLLKTQRIEFQGTDDRWEQKKQNKFHIQKVLEKIISKHSEQRKRDSKTRISHYYKQQYEEMVKNKFRIMNSNFIELVSKKDKNDLTYVRPSYRQSECVSPVLSLKLNHKRSKSNLEGGKGKKAQTRAQTAIKNKDLKFSNKNTIRSNQNGQQQFESYRNSNFLEKLEVTFNENCPNDQNDSPNQKYQQQTQHYYDYDKVYEEYRKTMEEQAKLERKSILSKNKRKLIIYNNLVLEDTEVLPRFNYNCETNHEYVI